MKNSTIAWIVVAVIVVIGGIYLFSRNSSTSEYDTSTPENNTYDQQSNNGPQGRVVFSVTDAAVNMGTISEINMKVSKVEVHDSVNGWATVSTTPHTYSLLTLNANKQVELLADAKIKTGTYDQVRLMVDSISVTTKSGVTSEAKVPSGELKINTKLMVNAGQTSSIKFDVLADKSIHSTGNGSYVFAPVVKTETKSGSDVNVNVDASGTSVSGSSDKSGQLGNILATAIQAELIKQKRPGGLLA